VTRLVLVHGRSSGGLDPDGIESLWLAALNAGLADAGSDLRVHDDDASFVYFGDTLDALAGEVAGPTPPITIHDESPEAATFDPQALKALDRDEAAFALAVAHEMLCAVGVEPEESSAVVPDDDADVGAHGAIGDALLSALAGALASVDRHVPGVSGAVLLLLVHDVHVYLHDPEVRAVINAGITAALPADEPAVVVAHSFGSVVAYEALRAAGTAEPWEVTLFCTLGSPLGIQAVRDALRSRGSLMFPPTVQRWVAVRDPHDLVTLHDLDDAGFPLEPGGREIENLHVDNRAPGSHAAGMVVDGRPSGYLAVPEVARLIGDALLG
jgi:hypothetical protein